MNIRNSLRISIFFLSLVAILILVINLQAGVIDAFDKQTSNADQYDVTKWPGKQGKVKDKIKFSKSIFMNYGLILNYYSNKNIQFSLHERIGDIYNWGLLEIDIYDNIEKAQLSLVESLNTLTRPDKPPMLKEGNFYVGDVAFARLTNGAYFCIFVRANVRVIVSTDKRTAQELAKKIDDLIINSPEITDMKEAPALVISEDFVKEFSKMK